MSRTISPCTLTSQMSGSPKSAQQYDGVILGHYHRAAMHRRRIDGRSSTHGTRRLIQMTYGRFNDGLELHRYRKGQLNLHPLPAEIIARQLREHGDARQEYVHFRSIALSRFRKPP